MKFTDNLIRLFDKPAVESRADDEVILPRELIPAEERNALYHSFAVYRDRAPWLIASQKGLSLASGIASELARLTVTEGAIRFEKTKDGDRIAAALSPFFRRLRTHVEYACATGGVIFKPVYDGETLGVEVVLPFDFRPLRVDGTGTLIECAFLFHVKQDRRFYTRVEEHRKIPNGYRITNRAFVSENGFDRGRPCPLSQIPEWQGISSEVEIRGLTKPLFVYFGIPHGNPAFPGSPLGAPVFRRAEELIRQADRQFERLLWEFEGGELAIDASEDAFRLDRDGKPRLPLGKERLYRTNALDACSSTNDLIKTFSPPLRDKSLINGLNRIIMFVEDACGLARGTFSDPSEVARTATEVRSMRQRTYSTVTEIQVALTAALKDLVGAVCRLALLYRLIDRPVEAGISFGDGVLTDTGSDREAEREEVKCGILSPEEFRAHWYGNTKGETT